MEKGNKIDVWRYRRRGKWRNGVFKKGLNKTGIQGRRLGGWRREKREEKEW